MMDTQVISLLITISTILVSIGVVYGSIKAQMNSLSEMFKSLTNKVEKHNNLIERMAVVERDQKTAFLRIDEIREDVKDIRREISKNAE